MNDVIVQYNVLEGDQTPEIVLNRYAVTIPIKENSGPTRPSFLVVQNKLGGCMPWEIQEDILWFDPSPVSGDVIGSSVLQANSVGFPFGQYIDSFMVVADGAANSPQKVELTLKVWRLHGDWNYSGDINISDLVIAVHFFFKGGPGPLPEIRVGDVNCSNTLDIVDLTYFAAYMFKSGSIPCGNPGK